MTQPIKHRTVDKGPGGGPALAVHTVEQIGPTRHRLPNGNLLLMNVPIARAGWMLYGPGEVPVPTAPGQNIIYVERTKDALFNERTMGSFLGAAITNDHPPVDVDPSNWATYSKGFALNVRQGTGDEADLLLADIMVTEASLIADIEAGKIEVSAGYDADYRSKAPGVATQDGIIGNHIAFVPKGRCGPRCAVRDSAFIPPPLAKERPMSTPRKQVNRPRVALVDDAQRQAVRKRVVDAQAALEAAEAEEADLEQEEDGANDGNVIHIHNHAGAAPTNDAATEERFVKLETGVSEIKDLVTKLIKTTDGEGTPPAAQKKTETQVEEEEDDDKKKAKTGDSAALATSYQELASQAEILVPGFKTPTFDAAISRASTVDRMCNARRKVLDQFGGTPEGGAILMAANGGKTIDLLTMDCTEAAVLFKNAALAKAAMNNASATRDSKTVPETAPVLHKAPGTIVTAHDINKANAEFYKGT